MKDLVMGAIEGLTHWGKEANFTSIHAHFLVTLNVDFRTVDRALQSLRREGKIAYTRNGGWKVVPSSAAAAKSEKEVN